MSKPCCKPFCSSVQTMSWYWGYTTNEAMSYGPYNSEQIALSSCREIIGSTTDVISTNVIVFFWGKTDPIATEIKIAGHPLRSQLPRS